MKTANKKKSVDKRDDKTGRRKRIRDREMIKHVEMQNDNRVRNQLKNMMPRELNKSEMKYEGRDKKKAMK